VSGKHKENEKLKNIIQRLEDENNMLKLKTEILLDMVSGPRSFVVFSWIFFGDPNVMY